MNIVKQAKAALIDINTEYEVTLYARVDYKESVSRGQGVMEYNPKGKAAQEITDLYVEIMSVLGGF